MDFLNIILQVLNFLLNVGIIVVIIGFLVLIHELGHFTVAKLAKIKVEEFALGMGPKLFGKKVGETEYMLKAFPIGGYVKILGEEDEGADDAVSKDPRNYKNKSKLVKFCVMIAGVTMNFLFAVIIFYFSLARMNFEVPLPGTLEDFQPWFASIENRKTGEFQYTSLAEELPAKNAGLPATGYIKSIDGVRTDISKDLVTYIQSHKGKTVVLNVCEEVNAKCADYTLTLTQEGKMGIVYTVNYEVLMKYEGLGKLYGGFAYAGDQLKMMGFYISNLFAEAAQTGNYEQAAASSAGSPIALYFVVERIKEFGVGALIEITASMSFSLAIINLLPIPALDGGRILLLGIEVVIRKPLNKKLEYWIIQISFYLLMALMLLVVLKDILLINVIRGLF